MSLEITLASREHFPHDMSVDIGEAAVDAVLQDGELFVIHAEQVEDGRVQIITVSGVHRRFESPVIALAVADAGPDAGAAAPEDLAAISLKSRNGARGEWFGCLSRTE